MFFFNTAYHFFTIFFDRFCNFFVKCSKSRNCILLNFVYNIGFPLKVAKIGVKTTLFAVLAWYSTKA